MVGAGVLPPDTRAGRQAARDTEGGRSMRARTRILTPLATSLLLLGLAACGESGSSGTGGGATETSAADATASGGSEDCAPVPGEQLVVLEDDQQLQNADNIIPAVNMATAQANPALLPALDAVSEALTTEELIDLNAAVDLERQSAERSEERRVGKECRSR